MADTLAKYKPHRPPAAADDRFAAMFAQAEEFLRQSEALRQDFPLREAKLRQAADLFDDASAQAAGLFGALDERRRSADHAAARASHAATAAETLLSDLADGRAAVLRAAQVSLSVQADTEAMRQDHYRLTEEIATARLDLQALIDEARATRAEVTALQAQSRPFAASAAPEAAPEATPGSILTTVPTLYPAGPTVLGFLLTQLALTDLTTGIALTNSSFVYTETAVPRSGALGVNLNKAKAYTTSSHSFIWSVGGSALWEWGVDFNTNTSINGGAGGSYLAMFDHTANGNAGADIWAISPAEQDSISTGVKATKWSFCGTGTGSAKDQTHLADLTTGTAVDLGGLSLTIKSQNARDHLTFVNAHATSKRNVINLGGFWKFGSDIGGVGTTEFILRDNTHSLNRLYVENTSAISAKMGLNTTGPVGGFHSATSNDPTLYNAIQTGLVVGYSTIDNRTWQVQQILDASQAENFMWFTGTLGASSTRATPVATSPAGTMALGIKANQTQLDIIAAPTGTNQTIVKGVSVAQIGGAATVGLYGVTPVIRAASNEDIRTSLIQLGAITGGVNPLNLNGGALVCGTIAAGAIGGSGTNFQVNRQTFTFAADADETLDGTHAAAWTLDVQAGVISTTRKIKLPAAAAGSRVEVINRNANPVILAIGANTGITVAAGRSATIQFPGGTTAFRTTPDVDYTLGAA